ncbi:hypothetical protein K438DRAFT_1754206 [Mycena galopus ATCC 62051]|nr:hypothetical protein K438DRAFT_1754206 [Mycena galopus ATCC 62051]
MYILSVIYLGSALILVLASPIANKPPSPASPPAISAAAVPPQVDIPARAVEIRVTNPSQPSIAPPPAPNSEGNGTDILQPVKLVNETLPHIGIDEEASPKGPHNGCVIA